MSIKPVYKNPASFGGVNALYRSLDNSVKTKDIKQLLETKDTLYTNLQCEGDGKLITRKLLPGYYDSIPGILRSMTLSSHEGKISFKVNANNRRVKIKTLNDARVVLEEGLCDVFGFHSQVVKCIEESAFVADPQAAFPVFYVYSDIV
ncbi:uncharacterized protein TNIN_265001 [Trichonephila inaurata madagascariensis]|uniref:Uncharacterized protein n=1 Tax=Trichonephila inaurata madagascariensis TaxID=2747483 RepID=A0A8X7BT10_9ARAC|nr:uncharacterized protein TNIN_265001 [Trichonephila inaurata madagascariensis]